MTLTGAEPRLRGDGLTLAYDRRTIAEHLTVAVPDRSFTAVVGPNACGKSTLLRALSRMLKPAAGSVLLDGADIRRRPPKQVARTLGLLPQSSVAPDGITVADLVARGRHPHQGCCGSGPARTNGPCGRRWPPPASRTWPTAMSRSSPAASGNGCGSPWRSPSRHRCCCSTSRRPIWTSHQIEVLDLCAQLHEDRRTVVAVLHDLNHAARYATHLIAVREGRVVAEGPPGEVVTAELVEQVFGLPCRVIDDPETGTPLVVPAAPRRRGPDLRCASAPNR
jgi:iron-siderophore transport system ATP-binding protein